jgi:hypothetical protein
VLLKREAIVEEISRSTLCRWFKQDALRPWCYRPWLFKRDPLFLERATVVLDLYAGFFQGEPLGPQDYLISADEKASLQVLHRLAESRAPLPGYAGQFEFEYERRGTVAYQAALDVRSGTVIGQVVESNCIETFNALVHTVMQRPPYDRATRVFWLVDGGSSHHRSTFPARLRALYGHAVAVHMPVHASWLNQIELYFSMLTRKVLTPHEAVSAERLAARILGFEARYNERARPFNWKFTAAQLRQRMHVMEPIQAVESMQLAA